MRDSPLTDLRALGSSFALHALLFVLASFLAFQVAGPSPPAPPRVIHAELGPVDNKAPVPEGGGAPGGLGNVGAGLDVRIPAGTENGERDSLTAAMISDALPSLKPPTSVPRGDSGPPLTGGILAEADLGIGGGGGSGGGSGGGIGRGIGPRTAFFGAEEQARSFAYVIDRSGSMSQHHALRLAKAELLVSLAQLPPDAKFAVLFYNIDATPILDARGQFTLRSATAVNKSEVESRLADVTAIGGTDHARALRAAFALRPEVIFFLTDALQMTNETAERLQAEAGTTRIQAIEFGIGPDPGMIDPLKALALATGGGFRYVDVTNPTLRKE